MGLPDVENADDEEGARVRCYEFMSISSKYVFVRWSVFNLLTRAFAIGLVLFALGSTVAGIYYLIDPAAAEGMETAGLSAGWLTLGVGAFCAAIGAVLLRARPYRPDLGDQTWTLTAGQDRGVDHLRSWWTGAPKPRS